MTNAEVVIIDYGLGNLFSIKQACTYAGLSVQISQDREELLAAKAVILPGVGAFGDAMNALERLDLVGPIKDIAARGTPLLGICLGQQLLFTESEEFGAHKGLDLIPGSVRYFPVQTIDGRTLKVPQVGWNTILPPDGVSWETTLLEGVAPGTAMYFVHSCHVVPEAKDIVLTTTRYGEVKFCSGCRLGNITAFQFHPERSGKEGLAVYSNLAKHIRSAEI